MRRAIPVWSADGDVITVVNRWSLEEYSDRLRPRLLQIAAEWGTRDYWSQWEAARVPALLLEAGNSVTPAGQMRKMQETGHRTTYLHVPGAGHLIHDDAPAVYQEAVEQFLATLASGA